MTGWTLVEEGGKVRLESSEFLVAGVAGRLWLEAEPELDLAAALLANDRLPAGEIPLGQIRGRLELARSFSGDHGARGELELQFGFYQQWDHLERDLRRSVDGLPLLPPPSAVERCTVVLLEQRGVLEGRLARLPEILRAFAGLQAEGQSVFAVIRAFEQEPRLRDALFSVLRNCRPLPLVRTAEDLDPGTWLVAWRQGAILASGCATASYQLDWVRRIGRGSIQGDLGLRLGPELGLRVGFQAEGEQIVVVHRAGRDPHVRVQVGRMRQASGDIGVNLRASVDLDAASILPEKLDELAGAILGLLPSQVLAAVKQARDQANPVALSGWIEWLARRLGTSKEEALQKLDAWLEQWDALPEALRDFLWSRGADAPAGTSPALERDLIRLAEANVTAVRELLETATSRAGWEQSPLAAWVEAALQKSVGEVLDSDTDLASLPGVAQRFLAVFSSELLRHIQAYIEERVGVPALRRILEAGDVKALDEWLRQRLEWVLGPAAGSGQLARVRELVEIARAKAEAAYRKAREALKRSYQLNFEYAWGQYRSQAALLDATFDLSDPEVESLFGCALSGDWRAVLARPHEGIRLHQGILTHWVRRYSRIHWQLPYFEGTLDRWMEAFARMEVREEDGRLFCYRVEASDEVQMQGQWTSQLLLRGELLVRPVGGEDPRLDLPWRYRFRSATRGLRTLEFEERLRPLAPVYFPGLATATTGGHPAREWAAALDRATEEVLCNGPGAIGDALMELEVELPARVAAAFFEPPAWEQARRVYMDMSRAVQRALRLIVPYCYFQDPHRYVGAEFAIAAAVLAYRCLPVSTSVEVRGDRLRLNTDEELYWDYRDRSERFAMLFNAGTAERLAVEMEKVRRVLEDRAELRRWAGQYDPSQLGQLRRAAWEGPGAHLLVESLLRSEALVIEHVAEAARKLARFRQQARQDPGEAVAVLAGFAEQLAQAFHRRLNRLFGGRLIRELAVMAFLEAARWLRPELIEVRPAARLRVFVLKPGAYELAAPRFLRGADPDPEEILLSEIILG